MGVRYLLIFTLIICCVFGAVQSQLFAQSFGGTGAASSGSTSNSGLFSNSIVSSSSNSAIFSSSNSAASSGNVATSSSNSAVATSNSDISSNSATAAAGVGAFTTYQDAEQHGSDPSLPEPNVPEPEVPEPKEDPEPELEDPEPESEVPEPTPELPEPIPESELEVSPVKEFARSISDALRNSTVLGIYTQFDLYQPHDLFMRVAHRLLDLAGIHDPDMEEVVGQAALDVGWVDSQLFFDTIGNLRAYFLNSKGVLTKENVEYLTLRISYSADLYACKNGVYDTESMLNAVTLGFFDVLNSYGFTTYNDIAVIFYGFAHLLRALSNNN